MRQVDQGAYLDDNGQLYLLEDGIPDQFDPPGYRPPQRLRATGFTYLDVPTYGWPLGVIYRNNSLQFATDETADRMMTMIRANTDMPVTSYVEEVKVGPITWARKIMIRVATRHFCAGLEAAEYARSSAHYIGQLKQRLA